MKAMARILLVDDNEDFRRVQGEFLSRLGHSVVCAGDGAEGQKISREQAFDLIITDLVMPEREGIESIKYWRQELPQVKILAVSGETYRSYLEVARRMGADRVLPKPFSGDDLREVLDELLR